VAFEVATRLDAPLDLIVVRKIRAPSTPELSVGAIAEGGVTYINPTFVHDARMKHEDAAALAEEGAADLASRIRLYRNDVPAPTLQGRVVVIVDDFVATGMTARAAARAARQRGARRVVLAVPAVAASAEPELRGEFDEVVALESSSPPKTPSGTYERLEEVSDGDALAYLRRARLERGRENQPGGVS
jgi:putative phosphoribosyl transferase